MILIRWQDCEIRLKERTRRLLDIGCGCSFGIYLIHILFLDGYKNMQNRLLYLRGLQCRS